MEPEHQIQYVRDSAGYRGPCSEHLLVRLAIPAIGSDPGMGILHVDPKSRGSFVYDVIEPLRPVLDDYLLTLPEERTPSANEFFETRQGSAG